ncbi:uncharacterized protein LOC115622867 [Scaptodrosophila lebanonensis]|uniref:Uncharacterized protein LOC115622867 n=1 Tax=Drosophila lebanonensis TaxID=7225 RepID=A0A6J2TCG4_DROLE|nr:uncharacterized protein LOC115622867 [Scaptodrosophila lebanonensis]
MDADFVNKYNQVLNRLKQIENFDGSDPSKLPQFLQKIEALMPTINTFNDDYKSQLIGHIKNKCTDRAREAVFTRQLSAPAASNGGIAPKAESWHKVKEQLLHNYAERESSYTLIHRLRSSVLDSNIELYYQKLAKLKQRLLNRKMTHNDTLYSVEDIERISLQVFRDHLPEPTYSMILRRNPKTMEIAYQYIVEVQQQFYTQSGPLAGEQGATFSTSRKQTFGTTSSSVGLGAAGVGIGVGAVGLGLGSAGFSKDKNISNSHAAYQQYHPHQNKNSKSGSYYIGAPAVGAGKTNPMFKSSGNPTFKNNYGSGSLPGNSSNMFKDVKYKDAKSNKDFQRKDVKATSVSGWRK